MSGIMAASFDKTPITLVALLGVLWLGCGSAPASNDAADSTIVATTLREVVFPPPGVFDHDFHVDDLDLECNECHHEAAASPFDTPHEEYFEDLWITCETCHSEEGVDLGPRACVDCHPRSPSGIADQTVSLKVATHRSCWSCHDSGTGVEASESCASCHYENDGD